MNSSTQAPQASALVVNRWNSWVQVWFPETDETTWIDLGNTPFTPLQQAGSEGAPATHRNELD